MAYLNYTDTLLKAKNKGAMFDARAFILPREEVCNYFIWRQHDAYYDTANYYSFPTVAENNARADKLMRQLRRFAVEHRENEIDWNDNSRKYCIYNEGNTNNLKIDYCFRIRYPGCIYFDTPEAARFAIETFNDELIWYFTEYKDSL